MRPRLILLHLLLAACMGGIAMAQTLVLDNFNNGDTGAAPQGWSVVTTGGLAEVRDQPSKANKSLLLAKTTWNGVVSASRTFPAVGGKIAVEFQFRVKETVGVKNLVSIFDSEGVVALSVELDGNALSTTDGSSKVNLQNLGSNAWYLLRVEILTERGSYDLYVDGVLRRKGARLHAGVSSIGKVSSSIGEGSTGALDLDGWNIYHMRIVPASGSPLVRDGFNSLKDGATPNGWNAITTGGIVTVEPIPFTADKSLRFLKNDPAAAAMAVRPFIPTSGKVTFEIKARTENTSGFKNLLYINGSNGTKAVSVAFDRGNISVYNGSTLQMVAGFRVSTWYIVRVVLDTATQRFDLFVDGERKISQGSFRNSVANVVSVTCGIDSSHTGILYVDNLKIYSQEGMIGRPPQPIFDVADYGAIGDGVTKNTNALQAAIDACAGSGGSVYLHDGIFLTGTIQLRSGMTLFIAPSATLLGSGDDADYPNQNVPRTGGVENIALQSKKALIYLGAASNVRIDGGGTIDGNGGHWPNHNGGEEYRAMLIFPAMCNTLTIQNVYLEQAAMWCLVPLESSYVAIRNLNLHSNLYGNRDGVDLLDTRHVLVEDCTIRTDDDAICPKSGIRAGIDDLLVRNCYLTGSTRASGIKFGTRSYGAATNMVFEDILIKNSDKSAMALESVDGSEISSVIFRRIEVTRTNSPFYLIIGNRRMKPTNDVARIGSIKDVLFEDIKGRDLSARTGNPISGSVFNGVEHPISNLTFRRVDITFLGGLTSVPPVPPEMGGQYPECNIWGDLPAYGYFLRHVDNVVFADCTTNVSPGDVRPAEKLVDVTKLVVAEAASGPTLTISKLHYNPSAPTPAERAAGYTEASEFEFIEVMNLGANPIDLDGVAFTEGLQFVFGGVLLDPGARGLIVRNREAFEFRYGVNRPVVGEFSEGPALSETGGRIRLAASDGADIDDFNYLPSSPWPTSPNGEGRSLVVIRPASRPDLNDPASWRPSASADGSPGIDDSLSYVSWRATKFSNEDAESDAVSGPKADPDGDGVPNLLEYAGGTGPLIPNAASARFDTFSIEPLHVGETEDFAILHFNYRSAAEDLELGASSSPDLRAWSDATLVDAPVDRGDGTFTKTFRSPLPVSSAATSGFLRVHATYSP